MKACKTKPKRSGALNIVNEPKKARIKTDLQVITAIFKKAKLEFKSCELFKCNIASSSPYTDEELEIIRKEGSSIRE